MMPTVDLDARRGLALRGGLYALATVPMFDPLSVAGPFDPAYAGRVRIGARPSNLAIATPRPADYPLPHDVLAEAATIGAILRLAVAPATWRDARVLVVHGRVRGLSDNPIATLDDVAPGYGLALDADKPTALRSTPCGASYRVALTERDAPCWSAAIAEWPIAGVLVVGAPRLDIRRACEAAGLDYREEPIR